MRLVITSLLAGTLALFMTGCGSAPKKQSEEDIKQIPIPFFDNDTIMPPIGSAEMPPDQVAALLEKIEKRNKTVEDDQAWIEESYEGLLVRKLTSISSREYPAYSKYLDKGTAYIIVHPAFFPFFHYPKRLPRSQAKFEQTNIVELLLKKKPDTFQFALLQAQERRMRDFLEFMSTREVLIILVIPKNYTEYSGYSYRMGKDEYMRYLNEVTNLSPSVVFVESKSPNRGYLTEDDATKLMEFLVALKAERVYVGGGYVGRCLEDFYALLTQDYGNEGIYVVPELADVSPRELSGPLARELLKSDGMIDEDKAARMMIKDVYQVQETIPRIIHVK